MLRGNVRVQTWMFGVVSRAHKKIASRRRFFQPSHHTACSTTPMQGTPRESRQNENCGGREKKSEILGGPAEGGPVKEGP